MKSYYVAFLLFFVACKKEISVPAPEFDVKTQTTTYSVSDTVQFVFSGDADLISFYSGEIGNDYDHREGRILSSTLSLSFQSQILDGIQPDQLSIMATTSLSDPLSFETAKAADWVNITDRFRLATHDDNRQFVSSGVQDISDLVVEGQPLYIGFRYVTRPASQVGRYNIWKIQNFLLESVNEVAAATLLNQSTAGWTLLLGPGVDANRSKVNPTLLDFRGNSVNQEVDQEVWAVTQAINFSREADFGPEMAVGIKGVADPMRPVFTHKFSRPGTYTVTFLAANENIYERKQVIKQLTLTITP